MSLRREGRCQGATPRGPLPPPRRRRRSPCRPNWPRWTRTWVPTGIRPWRRPAIRWRRPSRSCPSRSAPQRWKTPRARWRST
ncbi:MAG: hypothetical protein CWE10_06125 [Symbiobacterium thermophilum]|uniref:Uncharacterized protein n=1 Tax=Symbiobacterium thermophilum TaxID=2734 RepID=A0A953I878_SYMTR|nr:hypothetical protein [Symbiobacterium thermophilum]